MAQKFTPQQFKKIVISAARRASLPNAAKDVLRQKGISLYRSLTRKQVLGALKTLQKEGVLGASLRPVGVIRAAQKKFEIKPKEKPEMSLTELRRQEKKEKEETRKEKFRETAKTRLLAAYRAERAREEEKQAAQAAATAAKKAASRESERAAGLAARPLDLPID